jgi:hypothetical protein
LNEFSTAYSRLDEVQKEIWKQTGQSPEIAANNAYAGTQRLIAVEALAKVAAGKTITDYEKGVIVDAAKSGAITLSTQVAASIGLGVIASTVTKTFVKVAGDKVITASTQAARESAYISAVEGNMAGRAIRQDAIPAGSNLEYLAPGRVKFDGVEFRAVRDLSHLSEAELRFMEKRGVAFNDINGQPIHGHHYQQLDHRHADGFIVEIPKPNHNFANKVQHPKPTGEGLPKEARKEWNETLRKAYYSERARTELLKRGLPVE